MVQFQLELTFAVEWLNNLQATSRELLAGSSIKKQVKMPVIPRVGECIVIGNLIMVAQVYHNIRECRVDVECDVSLHDATVAYVEDKEGWNLDELTVEGKKYFFSEVKRYEKLRKSSE